MSTQDVLPRDARLIALLLASTPGISDAQPEVLQQLLEFAHRYTSQVLGDALVYAEHAGRAGSVQMDDVTLAVQSRVGWEFGGRVPKEHLLSLAARTNSEPLPPISETYGVRLPPAKHCLTAIDFDLVPNPPPPQDIIPLYEEEEEEDDEMDEDIPDAEAIQNGSNAAPTSEAGVEGHMNDALGLTTGIRMTEDDDEGGSDDDSGDGGDGLFDDDGEDDDDDEVEMMDIGTYVEATASTTPAMQVNGAPQTGEKRKLNEDDEYD